MKTITSLYLQQPDRAKDFFCWPLKPDWPTLAKTVRENSPAVALQILIEQNKTNSQSTAVKKHLDWLQNQPTLTVVTGQQLGFLVSPMYTLFKALSAVALADHLNHVVKEFRFVPVFWLETEDHDFAEIDHASFFDAQGKLQTLHVSAQPGGQRLPIALRTVPEDIEEHLHRLRQELQNTEFSDALFEKLQQFYRPGRSWSAAFAEQLRWMTEQFGLLLFDPAQSAVKIKSVDFFKRLIRENSRLVKTFSEQTKQIKEAGLKVQVPLSDERTYLFFWQNGRQRQPLLRHTDGTFKIYGQEQSFSEKELLELFNKHPEWCSSSVLTRPLWQSFLLPVISYVAGPAEIAYWAQTAQAFQAFDLVMPHLQPRFSATLIEPRIQRTLRKLEIPPDSVMPESDWIKNYLKKHQLADLEQIGFNIQNTLQKSKEEYLTLAKKIDPTLEAAVNKSFANVLHTLNKLDERLLRAFRQKEEQLTRNLQTVQNYFFPTGKPQERILSSVYFLNKLGTRWIEELMKEIDVNQFEHRFIEIES